MPQASRSAEPKLAFAVVVIGLLSGAAGAVLIGRDFEARVEAVGATVLSAAAEAFRGQQEAEQEKLAATLDALMASRELREAFQRRDREGLQRLAAPLLAELKARGRISHWYFHEPGEGRQVFLRVHRPELHGDRVDRVTLQRAVESGELGAGLELGRTAFALRVVRPWLVEGRLIGYLELAEEVDHFLSAMKGRSGDDYALLVERRLIDEQAWAAVLGSRINSWNGRSDLLVVDATEVDPELATIDGDLARLPETGRFLGETERAGRTSIRGVFPVSDASGRTVAALSVVHDFTAHHRAASDARGQAWATLLLLSVLASGLTVALAHWLVFRRGAAPGPQAPGA